MATRADRVLDILKSAGGRMAVADISKRLAEIEGADQLVSSVVSVAVAQDNKSNQTAGRALRFNTFGDDSEDWGYVSLRTPQRKLSPKDDITSRIGDANDEVRKRLKDKISKLTWQYFETNFLTQILEALGFHDVEVTQQTRDGGKDAICEYKRGIVKSRVIVSAKHWRSAPVPVSEVHRLRGLSQTADTALIVTSSRFTDKAKEEAEPSPNQRSVVLIDGDLIVETCLTNGIGVKEETLPRLYRFEWGYDDLAGNEIGPRAAAVAPGR